MTDASRIEDRYWTCVDGEYVWWFGPQAGRGRACHINGDEDRSNVQEGEFQAGQDDDMPLTNTEARAILGDKWPATWPPGEGAVESTTAPATGNDPDAGRHTPEPWVYQRGDWNRATDHVVKNGDEVALRIVGSDIYDAKVAANLHRIVACVNAMAGMADPAATIRELREGLAKVAEMPKCITISGEFPADFTTKELEALNKILREGYRQGRQEAANIATAAIARARSEGV